ILTRAWDSESPTPELTAAALEASLPIILPSGCGALAWWRLRRHPLAKSPPATQFHDAYRQHAIETAVAERAITQGLSVLRRAKLDPILCKGWSVARYYPSPDLRPLGDVDLYLPAGERQRAHDSLASASIDDMVDVDIENHDLVNFESDELYARSR